MHGIHFDLWLWQKHIGFCKSFEHRRHHHYRRCLPPIWELFLKLFQTSISCRLDLEIICTTFVGENRPIYSIATDNILICICNLSAGEIDLERHLSLQDDISHQTSFDQIIQVECTYQMKVKLLKRVYAVVGKGQRAPQHRKSEGHLVMWSPISSSETPILATQCAGSERFLTSGLDVVRWLYWLWPVTFISSQQTDPPFITVMCYAVPIEEITRRW